MDLRIDEIFGAQTEQTVKRHLKGHSLNCQVIWHVVSASNLTLELIGTLHSCFILHKNRHQCTPIKPELGRELGTNDYEWSVLVDMLIRLVLNGWSNINTTLYKVHICERILQVTNLRIPNKGKAAIPCFHGFQRQAGRWNRMINHPEIRIKTYYCKFAIPLQACGHSIFSFRRNIHLSVLAYWLSLAITSG